MNYKEASEKIIEYEINFLGKNFIERKTGNMAKIIAFNFIRIDEFDKNKAIWKIKLIPIFFSYNPKWSF